DASQKAVAIVAKDAPGDMLTMNKLPIEPLSPAGISMSALTPPQRELLMKLIDVYTGFMAPDIAADRAARYKKAVVEKISFASAGGGSAVAHRQAQPPFRAGVAVVQVDAVVTDRRGQLVPSLGQDDFEIKEDGKRVSIVNFASVDADGNTPDARFIVLLVDD